MKQTLLTTEQIREIANNIILTDHARARVLERLGIDDMGTLKQKLLHPYLAWVSYDDTFYVAVNTKQMCVIKKSWNGYVIVTAIEESKNDTSIADKFRMEFMGHRRKIKDERKHNGRKV